MNGETVKWKDLHHLPGFRLYILIQNNAVCKWPYSEFLEGFAETYYWPIVRLCQYLISRGLTPINNGASAAASYGLHTTALFFFIFFYF